MDELRSGNVDEESEGSERNEENFINLEGIPLAQEIIEEIVETEVVTDDNYLTSRTEQIVEEVVETETEPITVDIDEDTPNEFAAAFLPYDDHNYDCLDPKMRRQPPVECLSDKFATIGPIGVESADLISNIVASPRKSATVPARSAMVPMRRDDEKRQEIYGTVYSGGRDDGNISVNDVQHRNLKYNTNQRAFPQRGTSTSGRLSLSSESGISANPQKMPQRVMPEYTMMKPNEPQLMRGDPRMAKGRVPYSAADPSRAAGANAPAPFIVSGRGPVGSLRGKSVGQLKPRRDDALEEAPGLTPMPDSPRKQVHFNDATGQLPMMPQRPPTGYMSTPMSNILRKPLPPKTTPIPPHRAIVNTPSANTPARLITRPPVPGPQHIPQLQPVDSMPDNIIDDTPPTHPPKLSSSEPALPPHIADLAVSLDPQRSNHMDHPDEEEDEDSRKKRINAIRMELTQGPPVMAPNSSPRPTLSQEQPVHREVSGSPRGRGRPKSMGRPRNSLSASSSTYESSSPGEDPRSPRSFGIAYGAPHRPAVNNRLHTNVRTNLDFNSHLSQPSLPNGGASIPRLSYPRVLTMPPKVPTNKIEQEKPTPTEKPKQKRGRKSKKDKEESDDIFDNNDEDPNEDTPDEYGNWTMRCYCGMTHGEGLTALCDKCETWQHASCYGYETQSDIPDKWFCELCDPSKNLPYSREKAISIQKKAMDNLTPSPVKKPKKKSLSKTPVQKPARASPVRKSFQEMSKNSFSRKGKQLLQMFPKALDNVLTPLTNCVDKMKVDASMDGLVATRNLEVGDVIHEFIGHVCLPDECGRSENNSSFSTACLRYDGLDPTSDSDSICIDARKHGNMARYTRRSCRPNTVVRHTYKGGDNFHVYLVCNEAINHGTEITIPFDIDTHKSDIKKYCQCASTGESCCVNTSALVRGHKIRNTEAEQVKTEVPKEEDRRTRRSGRSSITEEKPNVDKETKENVVAPEKTEVLEREVKPEVEKKEVEVKTEVPEKRPRRSKTTLAKQIKEEVNYTLPTERNKPSREEMKIQAQLALMDGESKRSGEKRNSKGKNERAEKRKSNGELKEPVTKKKHEVVENHTLTQEEAEPPRKRNSLTNKESQQASSATTSSPLGNKKLWLRRHTAQSLNSELNSSATAQTAESVPSEPSSTKKRRLRVDSKSNAQTAETIRVQLKKSADDVMAKLGPKQSEFKLPAEKINGMVPHPQPVVKEEKVAVVVTEEKVAVAVREKKVAVVVKEEKVAVVVKEEKPASSKPHSILKKPGSERVIPRAPSPRKPDLQASQVVPEPTLEESKPAVNPQEEVPKKVQKKLSLEDYKKKRSNTSTVKTELVSPTRAERGFIPSMDNIAAEQQSLLPIHLPDVSSSPSKVNVRPLDVAVPRSLHDLKKDILLSDMNPSTSMPPPPPPPRPVEEERRISLADRLATEFGIGRSPSVTPKEIPPVGHLSSCPPPITRRDPATADLSPNFTNTTRKSRFSKSAASSS